MIFETAEEAHNHITEHQDASIMYLANTMGVSQEEAQGLVYAWAGLVKFNEIFDEIHSRYHGVS